MLSGAGIRQLHAAETEKYAHVTYFFNGGEETEWEGETRVLVPSPRDVPSYDFAPEMSAAGVAGEVIGALGDGYGFCVVNFANPDMVGHTGVIPGGRARRRGGRCGARRGRPRDGGARRRLPRHGRPRQRRADARGGRRQPAHGPHDQPRPTRASRHPVSSFAPVERLADLAPTALELLGIAIPAAMTGRSLVVSAGQRESLTFQQLVNSWCVSRDRLYACRALALEQPDLGILRKAQRGDERAFSIIVRAYERPIYNYVLRLVGDRAMAEDLTQEVFLRVYQGLPGFSLRSRFTTWLFQVTKNRVLDELRSLERRPRSVVNIDDIAPLESLDAPFERAETIDALWRAVEALNVDLKMALLLRDIVGLSYTEIADSLEITLATVKWRIYKAREEVQAALVREGVGVATSAAGALSTITE